MPVHALHHDRPATGRRRLWQIHHFSAVVDDGCVLQERRAEVVFVHTRLHPSECEPGAMAAARAGLAFQLPNLLSKKPIANSHVDESTRSSAATSEGLPHFFVLPEQQDRPDASLTSTPYDFEVLVTAHAKCNVCLAHVQNESAGGGIRSYSYFMLAGMA